MRGALSRITWIQIAIIGIVVCAIIGASLFSLLIKKQQKDITDKTGVMQSLQATVDTKGQAEADLKNAQLELELAKRRLAVYARTKMIPLSLLTEVDRYNSMVRLWREQGEVLGPLMEKHIASTGLIPASSPVGIFDGLTPGSRLRTTTGAPIMKIPKPPSTPSAITGGTYMIDLGRITMTTTKGLPQIYSFLRSFNHAPRLVTVGAPSITGTSPSLTVTVPLQVYYFVKGTGAPPPPAGGAGGGGGGGASQFEGL